MKSLNSFLNPKRKENLKFVLSEAFVDDTGEPIEWEMRQLSAKEGVDLKKQADGTDYQTLMATLISEALVFPDLHDKELLEGLSAQKKRPVLKASDALMTITSDAEFGQLWNLYTTHNEVVVNFKDAVDEAKN